MRTSKQAFFYSLVLLAVFALPAAGDDRIDALVADLSKRPLWINGTFPELELSGDASPAQVVERCFQMTGLATGRTGFGTGRVEEYKIVATQDVVIPPFVKESPKMIAVTVESNLGHKVVLMQFQGRNWWTRVFDAK